MADDRDIKTLAFFDLETTGLPQLEHNNTKITQLSVIACSVSHLLEINNIHNIPRITHKLSLCINPYKRISLKSEEITGLSNELLEHERKFDENTLTLLNNFLAHLQQPVCLIAHNGNGFDFPILRSNISKVGGLLSESVLCCDSLPIFRRIDKLNDPNSRVLINGFIMNSSDISEDEVKIFNSEIASIEQYFKEEYTSSDDDEESEKIEKLENFFINLESVDIKKRQQTNETTPEKTTVPENKNPAPKNGDDTRKRSHPNARRELFPFDDDPKKTSPKKKFTLREIYFRFFNEYPVGSHDSEDDVKALLKCACACNRQFVDLVKERAVKF